MVPVRLLLMCDSLPREVSRLGSILIRIQRTFCTSSLTTYRQFRQHRLFLLFLFLILISRAIVPPGFMPSPINSSDSHSLFMLCGGDWQSSQLLDALHDNHHPMANHASHYSGGHGFELCDFDALSMALAAPSDAPVMAVIDASAVADAPIIIAAPVRLTLRNNPARAPPPPGFVSSSFTS